MKKKRVRKSWVIVTGASKGLGYSYCEQLLELGYNLIGISRDTSSLEKLKNKYKDQKVENWNIDLSDLSQIDNLLEKSKNFDVEIVINNAGYGVWGYFDKTDLEKELNMIDLNIKALHIITKHFVKTFKEKNNGKVLNIASMGSFTPGPVFSSYYASKAYVLSLGVAINTELKKEKSKVRVITLCPGALKTEFWHRSSTEKRAKLRAKSKAMSSVKFARKSLKIALKAKRRNFVIVGSFSKFAKKLTVLMPQAMVLNSVYKYQRKEK